MGCLLESPPVLTATSDYPELCVEWLPNYGPNTADGPWCDITHYVTQWSTDRGRQYELDQFKAGTASLTLKATTRQFDPENSAGSFYGLLVPMRQLRISAVWNSTRYPIFQGFITDWGQTVPSDAMFVSTIQAVDGFGRLEQIKLPSSAWALEVLKDEPDLWFRLGETDTARVTDSSDGGNYGIFDNVEQGVEGLVPNDADGAVTVGHSTDERVTIQNPSLISGYPFTILALFKVDRADEYRVIFSGLKTPSTAGTDELTIALLNDAGPLGGSQGNLHSRFDSSSGGGRYLRSAGIYDDNVVHIVEIVYTAAATHNMYVDGVEDGSVDAAGSPAWWTTAQNGYTIGNYIDVGFGDFGLHGVADEVVVWNGAAIGTDRIAAHSLAAKSGWEGDDTGARVSRFIDAIDWPSTLRDIDTGISILGPASWSVGDTALSVLQRWADTEYGQFFMGKDGKLVWRSRHFPYLDTSSTTSQATFGDAHSAATLKYDMDGLDLPRDEALLRNPVIASRNGGVTVTVKDQSYVDKYGDRTWSSPVTEDQMDATVRDRATWLLGRYKELGSRLARMQITPRRDPSNLWPQVLGREIGERITAKRTPLGLNSEISVDQIIEGIRHEGSPKQWVTSFVGSPVDPNVGTFLILDDPTYGTLG